MPFIGQTSLPVNSPDLIQTFSCDASVYIGAWVYLDVSGVAQNAIATSVSASNVIGVVEQKPNSTACLVRVLGVTRELFTGLTINLPYFLSSTVAGDMTTSIPTGSGEVVLRLGTPTTDKKLLVAPQMRMVRS